MYLHQNVQIQKEWRIYMSKYLYSGIDLLCIVILHIFLFQVVYRTKKAERQQMFVQVLLSSIFFLLFDCFWGLVKESVVAVLWQGKIMICELYFISLAILSFLWFCYMEYIQSGKKIYQGKKGIMIELPLFFTFALIIMTDFLGGYFHIGQDGIFYRDSKYFVLTFCCCGYLIYEAVKLLLKVGNKKYKYERRRYLALAVFALYPLFMGYMQIFFPQAPLLAVGISMAIIQVYLYVYGYEIEQQDNVSIIRSYNSLFLGTYYCDIVENTCRLINVAEDVKLPYEAEGTYEEQMENYIRHFVAEEDQKRMRRLCSREAISTKLTLENPFTLIDFRQNFGDFYKWYRLHIILASELEDGRPKNVLMSVMDIDDEKRKEIAYQEGLEKANRVKSEFLSHMSHDIRTPMNAIVGFSMLLSRDADNPDKVKDYTRKIAASSQHLLGLINDILDMSKMEKGNITLNIAEFSFASLLSEVFTVMSPLARNKKQAFHMNTYGMREERMSGDKLRINQILINLLSNAVKYTPVGGEISLTVYGMELENNRRHLRFEITDNGIGMNEMFVESLFDLYTQEGTNTQKGMVGGSGLGIAITKNLVDMMNGTITVKSELGEGSTFVVDLKLGVQPMDIEPDFWQKLGIKRILVIDDYEHICKNIKDMMSDFDVEITCITSGRGALDVAERAQKDKKPYQLILVDRKMPDLSGIDTARCLHERLGKHTPRLLLMTYDWTEVEAQARKVGVDAFLPKPFFAEQLVRVVKEMYADNRDKDGTNYMENPLVGMHFLVAEDYEINAEIIKEVLEEEGADCKVAVNGLEAVKMFDEAAEDEFDMILMDIQMPVMNGYDATRMIRASAHPKAQEIPIIAMTADAFAEDVQKSLAAGMNAHIPKPIDLSVLRTTVKRLKS